MGSLVGPPTVSALLAVVGTAWAASGVVKLLLWAGRAPLDGYNCTNWCDAGSLNPTRTLVLSQALG